MSEPARQRDLSGMRYAAPATMRSTHQIPLGYLLFDARGRAELGQRLREATERLGSLQAAARELGVSYRTLCRWRQRWPEVVPVGEPGRPPLQPLQSDHDMNVIEKPRKKRGSSKTMTYGS